MCQTHMALSKGDVCSDTMLTIMQLFKLACQKQDLFNRFSLTCIYAEAQQIEDSEEPGPPTTDQSGMLGV